MKQRYSLLAAVFFAVAHSASFGQANTKLSNLVAPTTINQPLLPISNNIQTLGNSTRQWKSAWVFDGLYLKGVRSLYTIGVDNFFVGSSAGSATVTGSANTGVGNFSLSLISSGVFNTGVGRGAGQAITSGTYNTGVGGYALANIQGGNNNAGVGFKALTAATGSNNSAFGSHALERTTTALGNTATGAYALFSNTTGGDNTASGIVSSYYTTTGSYNTAVGGQSLYNNTDGFYNTAIGYHTLFLTKSGGNTALGFYAGEFYANGGFNTFLGYQASAGAAGISLSTAIGYASKTTASNQVRVGSAVNNSIGGYANWTNISDGRFKKNIKEDVKGLGFINKLHAVTYNLDISGIEAKLNNKPSSDPAEAQLRAQAIADKEKVRFSGFVAQDVEKIAKETGYEFSGIDAPKNDQDFYGLRYAEFVVPLVKAVQELSKINDEKTAQIDSLKAEMTEMKMKMEQFDRALGSFNDGKIGGLLQNIPNPSSSSTSIRYMLPDHFRLAQIMILDASGKEVRKVNLNGSGRGMVNVSTAGLASGTYSYSLLVDNAIVQTRKMIIAK